MQIYNTLSGKKEELQKTARRINFFVCGPTVSDYTHIGHGRIYLSFDMIVRYLRSIGYDIFYLQNITDIDDKIIKRAGETGVSVASLADKFTRSYLEDMESLRIKSVDKYARATKFIKQIVKQVETLVNKGFAYKIGDPPGGPLRQSSSEASEAGGYYFDISKFKNYGKLSRRTILQAEDSVSRIDESVKKRNKGDFCLWKFWHPNGAPSPLGLRQFESAHPNKEPYWNTTLGKGRPGWHIEDTAITEKFFGPQYDIHGGGLDLKFPHHEAEIAQQEAASGKTPFVKIWMHSGLLAINGEKMSKSLNNFITIRDLLKQCSPDIFRYMVLMHHYRSPMNYTDALLSQAGKSLGTIREFVGKLDFVKSKSRSAVLKENGVAQLLHEFGDRISKAMADDFNTPGALAGVFDLISLFQNKVWSSTPREAKLIKKFLTDKFEIFGINLSTGKIPKNIDRIAKLREKARKSEQFIQSDALRKEIESLGYKVEDTPLGQFVLKNF